MQKGDIVETPQYGIIAVPDPRPSSCRAEASSMGSRRATTGVFRATALSKPLCSSWRADYRLSEQARGGQVASSKAAKKPNTVHPCETRGLPWSATRIRKAADSVQKGAWIVCRWSQAKGAGGHLGMQGAGWQSGPLAPSGARRALGTYAAP